MNLRIARPVLALAVLASAGLASLALPVTAHAQYKVINTYKVGGEGGWDYVTADSAARRLYIARSGAQGAVFVYDLDTFAQTGKIDGVSGHGAVIDDSNPDGILADPFNDRVYILSHSSPNVIVLNSADGSIVGKIDLGGEPEQSQLDGKGHLYIDLEDKDAIAVVDTASLKVITKYDISSKGGGCAGFAMDTKNGILFAACRDKNNMLILNAVDGKILDTLPIGVGCDGAAFNSKTSDGTLTVIKENSATNFAVEQTVTPPQRARTITLDTKTGHLITATADFGPAPAAQPGQRSRPPMLPDSFKIVVVGK